jgi:hypothetical protein
LSAIHGEATILLINDQWVHKKTYKSSTKGYKSLYGAHLVASQIKRLIWGTYEGRFEPKYLQNYIDEYVFRFNRRKSKSIGKKFMCTVQQLFKSVKVIYNEIKWNIDPISEYFAT